MLRSPATNPVGLHPGGVPTLAGFGKPENPELWATGSHPASPRQPTTTASSSDRTRIVCLPSPAQVQGSTLYVVPVADLCALCGHKRYHDHADRATIMSILRHTVCCT